MHSESSQLTPSRRDVLAAATGVAAAGFAATKADSEPVSVARDRTLTPVSETLTAPLERVGGLLSVDAVGAEEGFRRFLDGDVDVLHATSPAVAFEGLLGSERLEYEVFESVVDGVSLLRPAEQWRSPAPIEQFADADGSDAERQVWAELVPQTVSLSDAADSASGAATESVGTAFESVDPAHLPADDAAVAVRGVRADQYAAGHGGLGYYEVTGEELTTPDAGAEHSAESPVGRLRYTYVNADSLRRDDVLAFVRLFAARARRTAADYVPFADAAGSFRPLGDRFAI